MGFLTKLKNVVFYGYTSGDFLDKEVAIEDKVDKSMLDKDVFTTLTSNNGILAKTVIENPYIYHDTVNALCRTIIDNIGKVDFWFVNKEGEKVENHKLVDLFNNPNPLFTKSEFIEKIVLGLLLPVGSGAKDYGGQVFIYGQDLRGAFVNFSKGHIPATLTVLYEKGSDYAVRGKVEGNEFKGWEYIVNGAIRYTFEAGELLRIRFINPLSDLFGLSRYTPAIRKVAQDIASDDYNASFFENDATASALLCSKTPNTTDDQLKRVLRSWYASHQGSGNHHKVGVLPEHMEYKDISKSHKDMEFTTQKTVIKDSLISTFGLNKIAIGNYEDVNYATIEYGHKLLWNDTYLPIIKKIVEIFQTKWVQYVSGDVVFVADTSGIEALQKNNTTQSQAYATYVNSRLPHVIAARLCNITFTEQELIDYPYLKEPPPEPSTFGFGGTSTEEEPEDDPDEPNEPNEPKEPKEEEEEEEESKSVTKSIDLKDQYKFTKGYYENVTKKNEAVLAKFVKSMFEKQEKEMLAKVSAQFKTYSKTVTKSLSKADIDKLLFDKSFWNKHFKKQFTKQIPEILEAEAKQLAKETQGLVQWEYTDETVRRFTKAREKMLSEITETTFESVKTKLYKIVDDGLVDNLTIQEIEEKIRSTIGDAIEARKGSIETIARTEMTTIQTMGRVEAFDKTGIEWVEWSAFEDENTRDTHLTASASEPVKLGDPFPGTGLRWPHDIEGAPGEVINCRCVLIASAKNLE